MKKYDLVDEKRLSHHLDTTIEISVATPLGGHAKEFPSRLQQFHLTKLIKMDKYNNGKSLSLFFLPHSHPLIPHHSARYF